MDFKQKLLKFLYPLIMRLSKSTEGKGKIISNEKRIEPIISFYDLALTQNNGQKVNFSQFKNKKVLLVNTASNCGYTGQYEELQQIHERFPTKVAILGFPANDFKEQEKGDDDEIAQFCQINFGVTFPLAKKSHVLKVDGQHPVYQWLTQSDKNGWNDHEPDWNFSKYLVDENGVLTHYFGSAVSPLGEEIGKEL